MKIKLKVSHVLYVALISAAVFVVGHMIHSFLALKDKIVKANQEVYVTEFKAATSNALSLPNKIIGFEEKYECHFGEDTKIIYREDQKIQREIFDIDVTQGVDATVRVSSRKHIFESVIQRKVSQEDAPDFFKARFDKAVAACAAAKSKEELGNQNIKTWGAGE